MDKDNDYFIDNYEKDECFCSGDSEYYIVTEDNGLPIEECSLVISGRSMMISYINFDTKENCQTIFPVSYCPKCGRKL